MAYALAKQFEQCNPGNVPTPGDAYWRGEWSLSSKAYETHDQRHVWHSWLKHHSSVFVFSLVGVYFFGESCVTQHVVGRCSPLGAAIEYSGLKHRLTCFQLCYYCFNAGLQHLLACCSLCSVFIPRFTFKNTSDTHDNVLWPAGTQQAN